MRAFDAGSRGTAPSMQSHGTFAAPSFSSLVNIAGYACIPAAANICGGVAGWCVILRLRMGLAATALHELRWRSLVVHLSRSTTPEDMPPSTLMYVIQNRFAGALEANDGQ